MNTTLETAPIDRSLRLIGLAALVVLTVVGAWALALSLAKGHGMLASSIHTPVFYNFIFTPKVFFDVH